MPQSTVARLESGRQNPSVKMLKRIAAATGTELVIEFRRPGRKHRAQSADRYGIIRTRDPGLQATGRLPR